MQLNYEEFERHIDKDGYYNIPTQEMDEEQLELDLEKKKMKKAEIHDEIDKIEIDDDKDDYESVESDIE